LLNTVVGGGDLQVDHLHGGKLLDHAARGQSRREGFETAGERYVKAISEGGDEDMRLDALDLLMEDRTWVARSPLMVLNASGSELRAA
jgi:hypothetical protein